MTNVKLTELTELATPTPEDILVIVDDVSGTPVTKKVTEKTMYNFRKLMSIVPAATFALGTGTSVQSAFPTTGDVFTLEASTTYEMEGYYRITKSGTTCTVGMAFALGGGASVTSIDYWTLSQSAAINTTGTTQDTCSVNQVAATVVTATATTAVWIKFKGLIRMNAGGTVTPQIIFSAAPTSPVMTANSYIKFTKIGTNVENTIGTVS
jgi:hypothetical protein